MLEGLEESKISNHERLHIFRQNSDYAKAIRYFKLSNKLDRPWAPTIDLLDAHEAMGGIATIKRA